MSEQIVESDDVGEALFGELTFSVVMGLHSDHLPRTLNWHQRLCEVRAGIPFVFVHDLGLLLDQSPGNEFYFGLRRRTLSIAQERNPHQDFDPICKLLEKYLALLENLSESPVVKIIRNQKNSDTFMMALLAYLFEGIHFRGIAETTQVRPKADVSRLHNLEPGELLVPSQAQWLFKTLSLLVRHKTQVLIAVEQLDVDALKLLQMTQGTQGEAALFLELHQMFSSPMANDIANFSLDLLPSILETKRSHGAQRYLVDGYASVETRGNLDSLLPSELVYDNDVFDRRYLHREQLYYAREKDEENKDRHHIFLVDASASMRGLRTVFARGVALAMAKKALLAGDKVTWRFFDSRLHEKQILNNKNMRVPYLLCFRGEKGRNTTEVFTALHRELARQHQELKEEVLITFFSHSRCVIRPEVVLGLKNFAKLRGVFVKPNAEELYLDYLNRLDGHHVISASVLEDRAQRQDQALHLLGGYQVGAPAR